MLQQRVVLHVGTPKSGTTYLQDLMWANRGRLAEAGVRYPGNDRAAHFHAAVELAYGNFHGWTDPDVPGAWSRLVEQAREHGGTTVISHELFGDLSQAAAARAIADLDFAEVHVVVTARDLARQLPAVWQEDVKNRHFLPYEQFLDAVRPGAERDVERPGPGRPEWHGAAFWLRQDVPAVLRRWSAWLPAGRLHLVTVPPAASGPDVLWQRFAGVVGVDPDAVEPLPERRNASMSPAGTELLRRLNERLGYSVDWSVYGSRVTHSLALTALTRRASDAPLPLPASEQGWVSEWSQRAVDQVRHLGCQVVGDLEDLRSRAAEDRPSAAPPDTEQLLELALDALAALIPGPLETPTTVPGASSHLEPSSQVDPAAADDAAEQEERQQALEPPCDEEHRTDDDELRGPAPAARNSRWRWGLAPRARAQRPGEQQLVGAAPAAF